VNLWGYGLDVRRVWDEILKQARLGWVLEKLGKNFRQYFNIKNPRQHKTIIDADPTFYVGDALKATATRHIVRGT